MDSSELRIIISAQVEQAKQQLDAVANDVKKMADGFVASGGVSSEAIDSVKRSIEDLKVKLDEIHDKTVTIHLDDSAANRKLDEVKTKMDEVAAQSQMGGGGGGAALGALIAGAIPLLSSVGAPLLAVAGGLASSFAAATAGVVGFAAVAKSNLTPVTTAVTNINAGLQAYDSAITKAQKTAALDKIAAAWGTLDSEQQKAAVSLMQFEQFWQSFTSEFKTPILEAFRTSLAALENLMIDFAPVITASGQAINELLSRFNSAVQGGAVRGFFNFLAQQAGPAIIAFGTAFGNTMRGVMSLLEAFAPMTQVVEQGLMTMTQRFAQFSASLSSSNGFQQFLQYAEKMGPVLMSTLGGLLSLISRLLQLLAPVGAALLMLINDVVKLVNILLQSNSVIGELIEGVLRVVADILLFADGVVKVLNWLMQLNPVLKNIIQDLGLATAAFFLLNAVMDANPIGLIITLIALLITAIVELARAWVSNWDGIQDKTKAVAQVIEDIFGIMVNALKAEFYGLEVFWLAVLQAIMNLAKPLMDFMGKFAPGLSAGFDQVYSAINNARVNGIDRLNQSLNNGVSAAHNLAIAAYDVHAAFSGQSSISAQAASSGAVMMGDGSVGLNARGARAVSASHAATTAATNSAKTSANASMQAMLAQINLANTTASSQQAIANSVGISTKSVASSLKSQQQTTLTETQKAQSIWSKYLSGLTSAQQTAKTQVDKINATLLQNETTALQQYEQKLQQAQQSIANFAGNMFSSVTHTNVSGQTLTKNLQDQVSTITQYNSDLQTLTSQNLPAQFLQQIEGMGPKAEDQIHALATMTQQGLQQYIGLWQQEQQQAEKAAETQLQPLQQQTTQKIQQLQANAQKQIHSVQTTYLQQVQKLTQSTNQQLSQLEAQARLHGANTVVKLGDGMQSKIGGLVAEAKIWGQNIGNSLAQGMSSAAGKVQQATQTVTAQIANNIGFHSPAKEGPGAEADVWMPNLINLLVSGIQQGTPKVRSALSQVMMPPNMSTAYQQAGAQIGASAAGAQVPSNGVSITLQFNGNVYGQPDFEKQVTGVIQKQIVPVLVQQLRQPARAMGVTT